MKLIKFLSFIIIALVIGNVTLTNASVDDRLVVASLSQEISSLENAITILRSQVAQAGSIKNITSRLEAMGFTDTPKVASLPLVSAVASR